MKTLIIDYGLNNLQSIAAAVSLSGAEPIIEEEPHSIEIVDNIILPGVGTFAMGMQKLIQNGWIESLKKAVLKDKKPLLGICLGMQLLSTKGYEVQETLGLGFIDGEVKKIIRLDERIPHVGWNNLLKKRSDSILNDIPDDIDCYFVHSFEFIPDNKDVVICTTDYSGEIVALIRKENVYGMQFHPEKSGQFGIQMIKNFIMNT